MALNSPTIVPVVGFRRWLEGSWNLDRWEGSLRVVYRIVHLLEGSASVGVAIDHTDYGTGVGCCQGIGRLIFGKIAQDSRARISLQPMYRKSKGPVT